MSRSRLDCVHIGMEKISIPHTFYDVLPHNPLLEVLNMAVKVPEIVLFSGGIIKYVSSKLTAVISH